MVLVTTMRVTTAGLLSYPRNEQKLPCTRVVPQLFLNRHEAKFLVIASSKATAPPLDVYFPIFPRGLGNESAFSL